MVIVSIRFSPVRKASSCECCAKDNNSLAMRARAGFVII